MSFTNQQPWAGVAGAPDGIVMVRTANFMTLLNGPPQGVLAGQSGSASVPPDMVWDWFNKNLYICTQSSGTPAGTVWTELEFVGPFVGTNIYAENINASNSIVDQGSLTVDGPADFGGNASVAGDFYVGGNTSLTGSVDVTGPLSALAGGTLGGVWGGSPVFNFPLNITAGLRLANSVALQAADYSGTYRNLLWVESANDTQLYNNGGGNVGLVNQAGSAWLLYSNNTGNVIVPNTLQVNGTLLGLSTIQGAAVNSTGTMYAAGAASFNSTVAVAGATYLNSTLNVAGGTGLASYLSVGGNVVITGNTTINSAASVASSLNVGGPIYANGGISNISGFGGFFLANVSGNPTVSIASGNYIQSDGSSLYYNAANHSFTGGAVWIGGIGGMGLFRGGDGNSDLQMGGGPWTLQWVAATGDLNWIRYDGVQQLHVAGADGTFGISSGNAFKPGGGTWSVPSDNRLKTVEGEYTKGLADLQLLEPIVFSYTTEGKVQGVQMLADGRQYVGLDAQATQAVWPSLVSSYEGEIQGTPTEVLVVDHNELTFALVNAVVDLANQVAELRK